MLRSGDWPHRVFTTGKTDVNNNNQQNEHGGSRCQGGGAMLREGGCGAGVGPRRLSDSSQAFGFKRDVSVLSS